MRQNQPCASCGAAVPQSAAWCPRCLAPVAAQTQTQAPPAPSPKQSQVSPDSKSPSASGNEAAAVNVDAWMAALSDAEGSKTKESLSAFSSRGARVGLMIGGTVAVVLLILAGSWVVSLLGV